MKIAYIVDSASFLNEQEAKDLDLFFVPLYILIDNESFKEGVDLDREYLYKSLEEGKSISTSQASPGEIQEVIEKLKKDGYDCAIYSGIASGLSKTQENFANMANSEDFKLYLIDSKNVGFAQLNSILEVRKQIESGVSIEDAIASVQPDIDEALTVIVVGDLGQLVKSGRMKSSAATVANLLNIKLVLQLDKEQGGKIELVDKVRTAKKAYKKMIDLLFEGKSNIKDYVVLLADFKADEAKEYILNEIKSLYPDAQVINKPLIPTVGSHSGLNTVGMQIAKKFVK